MLTQSSRNFNPIIRAGWLITNEMIHTLIVQSFSKFYQNGFWNIPFSIKFDSNWFQLRVDVSQHILVKFEKDWTIFLNFSKRSNEQVC